jgi:hypothetical protein
VLAHLYAVVDDEAHAVSYLERAYEEHNRGTLSYAPPANLDSMLFSKDALFGVYGT